MIAARTLRCSIAAALLAVTFLTHAQAPASGAAWTYGYADAMYGRHKHTYTVEVAGATDASVTESFAVDGGAPRQSALEPRGSGFVLRLLAPGRTLIEFSPYAGPAAEGGAPPQLPPPTGYPTGYASYLDWTTSVRVAGWESVSVPTGSFRALRIEITGTRGSDPDPFWQPKQAGRFQYAIWYAPEVRRYVKFRHQSWAMTAAPFGDEIVELRSYRLK